MSLGRGFEKIDIDVSVLNEMRNTCAYKYRTNQMAVQL